MVWSRLSSRQLTVGHSCDGGSHINVPLTCRWRDEQESSNGMITMQSVGTCCALHSRWLTSSGNILVQVEWRVWRVLKETDKDFFFREHPWRNSRRQTSFRISDDLKWKWLREGKILACRSFRSHLCVCVCLRVCAYLCVPAGLLH